ncbi:MAG: hypothetical protein IPL32_14200 [Chloracidobacterium sp.]|nr:hypothetical protein [Chloracidobacterium sp.]
MFAVADMIVIHFAFGSPFGVYQIARGGRVRSARSAVNVALHFTLWPIFALAFLRKWLTEYSSNPEETSEGKIADIRSKLEELVFSTNSPVSILGFREVFARYTDLTSALNHGRSTDSLKNVLNVSGHKNITAASACMARRNRRLLHFHQEQARNEFIEMLLHFHDVHSTKYGAVADCIVDLGYLLEDHKTLEVVGRLNMKGQRQDPWHVTLN